MTLDKTQREQIYRILIYGIPETALGRGAELYQAFGDDPIRIRCSIEGTQDVFVSCLMETLTRFGDLRKGEPALCHLLQSVRRNVGVREQAEIDALNRGLCPTWRFNLGYGATLPLQSTAISIFTTTVAPVSGAATATDAANDSLVSFDEMDQDKPGFGWLGKIFQDKNKV